MGKISVVINTLNEEKNLPRALASIRRLADEVVVVDAKSTDGTVELAKKAGAKVYEYKKPVRHVEPVRNFAISKATGDWILILDADEELPKSLVKKFKEIASDSDPSTTLRMTSKRKTETADYYRISRKNVIFGKWLKHSRWWPDYNIRFFKKGFVSWSEIIHSVPTTKGKGLDLPAKESLAIIHHNYQTVEQYLERMNRYTTLYAKGLVDGGYEFYWKDLIKKPADEFLSRYFAGEGYKDGFHGLALAGLQAFSEFVMYLKVWSHFAKAPRDKQVKVNEVIDMMRDVESDIHYWQADALFKSKGGVVQRIKRKFRLP